jgi:hypothetical protein
VSDLRVHTAHGGSYFLPGWELRITSRCLDEDFGLDSATTPIGDLLSQPIVKALIKDRATDPDGGKSVGPEAGRLTIRRLAYGNDHRGATWWDRDEKVVWLCAYHGKHRSGQADDPFKGLFPDLIASARLRPVKADYERLFEERDERFVDLVPEHAQELLAQARDEPGVEKRGIVGGEATVGCLVEVVDTLEDTYVAFFLDEVPYERWVPLLNAFHPARFDEWEQVEAMPHRPLDTPLGEVCYRYLKGQEESAN